MQANNTTHSIRQKCCNPNGCPANADGRAWVKILPEGRLCKPCYDYHLRPLTKDKWRPAIVCERYQARKQDQGTCNNPDCGEKLKGNHRKAVAGGVYCSPCAEYLEKYGQQRPKYLVVRSKRPATCNECKVQIPMENVKNKLGRPPGWYGYNRFCAKCLSKVQADPTDEQLEQEGEAEEQQAEHRRRLEAKELRDKEAAGQVEETNEDVWEGFDD